ncbi:hypothetical protein [Pseudobacteroides cellulosolvens]|uniref:Uncharacterized protein n=1 Tax=Pseudobacteroides cellulosolvens ATCC 35603 = DSM 2933 TaxID=398512 RepID=A0A0L6JG46_9FIRM|nr:hypothetical protein [Pseudobacteroides cellulosolvens]KNY24831.1 hypothetical protein Bccel_0088 [Pseudobacteroides cellulosolvens ATCC 35603 = DSM 2933]
MITRFKFIRESEFEAFERKLWEVVKEADKAGYEVDIKYQMAPVGTTLIYTAIVIGRGETYEPIQDT